MGAIITRYFINYIIFGIIFTMIYDWLLSRLDDKSLRFNNIERVLMVFTWPFMLLVTIINIIRYLNKK
jgi:hypothetical protein